MRCVTCSSRPTSNWGKVEGANKRFGVLSDCVYGGHDAGGHGNRDQLSADHGLGLQRLVRALLDAAVHQSVFGGYYAVSYDRAGSANAMLCTMDGNGTGWCRTAAVAGAAVTTTGRLGRRHPVAVGRDQVVLPRRRSHL